MKEYQSKIEHAEGRYAILASRWNSALVDELLKGVKTAFSAHGVAENQQQLFYAPGAYEFPVSCKALAESGKFDAIITLGAVIRGDTPHFDYVAGECASGITRVSLDTGLPIIFGVLTVNTLEQAQDRAFTDRMNKGGEFAETAMEMVTLMKHIRSL